MAQELSIKITADNGQFLQAIKAVMDSLKDLNKAARDVEKTFKQFSTNTAKGFDDTSQSADALTKSLSNVRAASGSAGSQAAQAGNTMKNSFAQVPGFAIKAAQAFGNVAKAAIGIAQPMVAYHSSLQQNEAAFASMLGSASAAKAFMNDLQQAAVDNSLDFPQLVEGAQRMMSLGWAARDIIPALTAVGDTAARQADTFPSMVATVANNLMMIAGTMTQGMFDSLNAITAKVRDITKQVVQAILDGNIGQAFRDMIPPDTLATLESIKSQWTIFITDVQRLLSNLSAGSEGTLKALADAFLNMLPSLLKVSDIMVNLANAVAPVLTEILQLLAQTLAEVTRYSDNLITSFATYVIVNQILGWYRSLIGTYGSLKAAMIAITRITVFQNMISGAVQAIKGIKNLRGAVNALRLAFTNLSKGNVVLLALSAVSLVFGDKIMDFIESKLNSKPESDSSPEKEDDSQKDQGNGGGSSGADAAVDRSQSALRISEAMIRANTRRGQQDLEQKISDLDLEKQQNGIGLEQYYSQKSAYEYQQQQLDLNASQDNLKAVQNTLYRDSGEKNERIAALQQEIEEKTRQLDERQQTLNDIENISSRLAASGLLSAGMSNVEIDLVSQAKAKMGQSLSKSGLEFQRAILDLFAQADDIATKLAEVRGDISSKQKAKLAAQYDAMAETFRKNGSPEGAQMVNDLKESELLKINFAQVRKNLELANGEMATKQAILMDDLATGAKSAAQVTEAFADQYKAKTNSEIETLQQLLDQAVQSGDKVQEQQIRDTLRKIPDSLSHFTNAVIQQIDATLQEDIARINADPSMTRLQKEAAIESRQREASAAKAASYTAQAKELREMPEEAKETLRKSGIDPDVIAAAAEKQAQFNNQIANGQTLMEKVGNAAKQAFEDGILDFLQRGIFECKNFGDAVRNLAITILQEIQKIYAQQMAQNIMVGFGLNPQKNAAGGEIKGPGTGTSDNILSWLSNGEFVIRAAAVKKYGTNFLHSINQGLLPPKSMFPAFATGGLVGISSIGDGPKELAASLTSNTNVPLKIVNVTDPNEVGKYMQSRHGEKVMVNWMKNNASVVRQVLAIRG